jgi:hypothetical protein
MPVFHRREQPPALSDYHGYKPYLRRDFLNRCAYCLLHEGDEFAGGSYAFAIDHFRPKEYFPHLETTYENLYYTCRWCNRAKWDIWPSEDELGKGYCFVDPCQEDLYLEHSRTDRRTGLLEARSKTGDYTIRNVRLNRRMFASLRVKRFEAQAEIDECAVKIAKLGETTDPVARELVQQLREKIRLLDEKFINPKIPYEAADLEVS